MKIMIFVCLFVGNSKKNTHKKSLNFFITAVCLISKKSHYCSPKLLESWRIWRKTFKNQKATLMDSFASCIIKLFFLQYCEILNRLETPLIHHFSRFKYFLELDLMFWISMLFLRKFSWKNIFDKFWTELWQSQEKIFY